MPYNTGNAIGSNDPRDLFDNAGNLDKLANGPAVSYHDRLGVSRKSWSGMEDDFQAFLLSVGYQDLGIYAGGLQVTARNQVFLKDGEYYRAKATTALPYTLTGTWGTDGPFFLGVGDAVLRQDIESGLFLESTWAQHRGSNVGAMLDAIGGVPVIALYDGSDETAALQTAINLAISLGLRYVRIDGPLYAPGTLTDRSNVIFVGKGTLTGAYRRAVYPSRNRDLSFPGIVPERHLKQMRSTNTPTVVFMGDSLLTQVADSIGHSTSLASMLEQKIRRDNPSKGVTFHNRAIGGMTWAHADSVPAVFPSWYTVTTDPWLDYIEALNPDLVIFNFGMNDAEYFNLLNMNSVILKIMAWAKVPDIVLCTPMVSSLEADPTFSWASAKAGQEGRDAVAGYTRSLAINNGYGLIDINRVFNLVRDGRDLCTLDLERIATAVDVSATGAYTAAQPCHGYVASCVVSGDAAFIADAFN
ncbi:hypothetical protein V2S84_09555, partial [Azotobacter chroococcum]|nr:hypothetical protein [Azotobacter chroococcum]